MKRMLIPAVCGAVLVGVGSVMFAGETDRPSGTTDRPGIVTRSRVWVENRGASEAVPVAIHDDGTAPPVRVQIAGTPTVALSQTAVLEARYGRQLWDYRALRVPAGQDPVALLQAAGSDGWETTGLHYAGAEGIVLVLKRPR